MNHSSTWYQQKQDFESLCKIWDKAQADGIFTEKSSRPETRSDFFGNYSMPDDSGIDDYEAGHWSDVISRSGEIAPDESMMLMEQAKAKAVANSKKKLKKKLKSPLPELGEKDTKKEVSRFKKAKSGKGGDLADGDVDITEPYSRVKSSLEYGKIPSLKKKVKDLANNPNFIKPDTYGPDSCDQQERVLVTAGLAAHPLYGEIERLKHQIEEAGAEMSTITGLDAKRAKAFDQKYMEMMNKLDKLSSELVTSYRKSRYYN
jgi:hypothetical protein